ncbi:uncharacterized protein DUF4446 [Kribbella orskensis]|uniref:Uncharacterized protein DUF4446 n=1 Tax=Kribbella orskensis TaxID=2512216 RepID=A0ABY2BP81_9ACTN|nr:MULTISPECIES: DUF4446 family protein [Kribbella]TCN39776.1 uncharacterized protein DUF4446 [Kribbella sp. VKM Ac-2500]TCO27441.1 uncharacterized protein DUF4446 [Kribbella orskensis]
MSSTLAGAFGIAALFVAVLALVFAVQALRAQSGTAKAVTELAATPEPQQQAQAQAQPEAKPGTVKSELRRLSRELEEARTELRETLQHLAVVRYDAYGEMSGRLSWSMALLDDNGDGVVLTSINSRNDARSYAKEVKAFESDAKLSPEEEEAIDTLRKEASPTLGNPDHQ